MKKDIRLLIVDDSKMMRDAIVDMFSYDSSIQVVATAANGQEALQAITLHNPDVITLDVSMPIMDGITALKHIMIKSPIPTIMLSSLTLEGARVAFDALRFGAVDFISKPSALLDTGLSAQEAEIRNKIESAVAVEVNAIKYIREAASTTAQSPVNSEMSPTRVVAIGASEGGYGPLLKIIPTLSENIPYSYLVTLYASREHLDAFASYLNSFSRVQVKRAIHGELLHPGVCYLNSGMDYMTVHNKNDNYTLHVSPAPFASRKGAIDMMMFSVADVLNKKSIGVLLSGMGSDGSEGLEEITHNGGQIIIQTPETCLCKQMTENAIALNNNGNTVADIEVASTIHNIHTTTDANIATLTG